MTKEAPTLYVVRCRSCDALEGTQAGDEPCPDPGVDPTDPDDDLGTLGHDWSEMDEWPLRASQEPPREERVVWGVYQDVPGGWVDVFDVEANADACVAEFAHRRKVKLARVIPEPEEG